MVSRDPDHSVEDTISSLPCLTYKGHNLVKLKRVRVKSYQVIMPLVS